MDTEVAGAQNVVPAISTGKEERVHMKAIPETIGHIQEAQEQSRLVVENEDSDLSEGESPSYRYS